MRGVLHVIYKVNLTSKDTKLTAFQSCLDLRKLFKALRQIGISNLATKLGRIYSLINVIKILKNYVQTCLKNAKDNKITFKSTNFLLLLLNYIKHK